MSATEPTDPLATPPPVNYERYFVPTIGRPAAHDLLHIAKLQPGERVLDVGCGTGLVTRLAAERVGKDGAVDGLDVNPGMLAVARSTEPDMMGITWHQASAEAIPLPDQSVDVVLCQMSLQFVPDRAQALREMRRVLRDGGRVVLNLPGPAAPPFAAMEDALGRHVSPEAAGFIRAVFSLHDETELQRLLEAAGFREATTVADTQELELPPAREFLWQYIASTPLAMAFGHADADTRAGVEREVVAGCAAYATDDGMRFGQRMVIGSARR